VKALRIACAAAALLRLAAPLSAAAGELRVGAAVSLKEPLDAIAARYEVERPGLRVRLAYGASNDLAEQIRAGAPLDVFVSADPALLEALAREGLAPAGAPVEIASNRLVVVAAADAPFTPARPEDLADPRLRRIAVPDAAVPVGRYAREWLAARGLLARLEPRLVRTEHARATLAAVDAGSADAAIVYATDARSARSARVAFEIPAAEQPRIAYAAAPVPRPRAEAAPGESEAQRFVAFLRGPEARALLETAGFGPP
jgi:molybdate transport system substrate-binding protein